MLTPEMLAGLFEQAPHASLVLTPELTLVAANARARRLLGEEADLVGKPLFSLLAAPAGPSEAWQGKLRQSYADLLASRKPVGIMLPARSGIDADGRAMTAAPGAAASAIWHISHAPLLDQDGRLVAIATHAHALAGVEVAIAQVSGFATTQMAAAPAGSNAAGEGLDAAGAPAEVVMGTQAAALARGARPDGAAVAGAAPMGGAVAGAATGGVDRSAAAPIAAAGGAAANPAAVTPAAALADAGMLHILLVEDSEDLRLATVEQMQHLGHRVTGVGDAEQATRLLEESGRFDLLFTDLTLPKMTGAELARMVLQGEQPMPVVITSGYGRALANAQSLDAVFLPKPYRFEDLQSVLQQVLERRMRTIE